jgi:lysine/ornithine N-monooxygenase
MVTIADRFDGVTSMQRLLRKQQAEIVRDLRHQIMALPENPDITVISTKPVCFVMNWSALSNRDWTPEYYNFNKQYRAICREIRDKNFDDVIPFLRKVIADGAIKKIEMLYWWGTHKVRTRVNIHPQVIENIKVLL